MAEPTSASLSEAKLVQRIVLTGAESSGKTTLARILAKGFDLPLADEYARAYLEKHGPGYTRPGLLEMSRRHIAWQKEKVPPSEPLGIFDTDLINYKIWFEEVFGSCPREILDALGRETNHAYLLCAPDLPWEPDPLRESPNQLEYLFKRHRTEIEQLGRSYEIIRGTGEERIACAKIAFRKLVYHSPR